MTEDMLVAIDWSGRADDRGRTAWMAVIEDGVLCRLENGRSRPELRDELIRLRGRSGRLVAGIDFAFGFPRWYAEANGWASGRDIWRAAYCDGESWLASAGGPFWGRTTKRPRHAGDPLRRTERTAGGSPRSVFQIGGAGAVGTGSIRGMQVLHELAEAGFTIWPFEPAGEAVIIEIYPRLFTGKVVKSSAQACLRHLNTHYPEEELPDLFRGMAAATEDAFDAAVSALEMARARDALLRLPDGDDIDRIEGRIWAPLPLRRSSTPHRKRREGLRGDRTPIPALACRLPVVEDGHSECPVLKGRSRSAHHGRPAYGPDHPEVGLRLNNFTTILRDLHKLAHAIQLSERALAITEAAYGPDHPTVIVLRVKRDDLRCAARARGDHGCQHGAWRRQA